MSADTLNTDEKTSSFPITEVNRVKRVPDRGRYDKKTV
jgi:hypothetical protein